MKPLILEHYHGDLSGKRHLHAGEQYEVPGEVLTQEAAEQLVERGKAVMVAERESGAGATDATGQVEEAADEPSAEFPQIEETATEPEAEAPAEQPEETVGKGETATEPTRAAEASMALTKTMSKRRKKK